MKIEGLRLMKVFRAAIVASFLCFVLDAQAESYDDISDLSTAEIGEETRPGNGFEDAVRRGKADFRIALFRKESDQEKGRKTVVLLTRDDAEDSENEASLNDLKRTSDHWTKLKEKASLKIRALEASLKGAALFATLYQPYHYFHKGTHQNTLKREFIHERIKNEDLKYSSVLKQIRFEKNLIVGSFLYSSYTALGHFLKPIYGEHSNFRAMFVFERMKIRSQVENAVSELKSLYEKYDESSIFVFETSHVLFDDVKARLQDYDFKEYVLPKFPNEEEGLEIEKDFKTDIREEVNTRDE